MRCGITWAKVALSLLLFTAEATAGCPNRCDLTVENAVVAPELSCLSIDSPEADDCDCEVRLVVRNACDANVEPLDFELKFCGNDVRRCEVIAPNDYGVIAIPLTNKGKEAHVFPIKVGEEAAEITVATEVSSFSKKGCSFVPPALGASSSGFGGFVLLILVLTGSRRRWLGGGHS